MSNLLAPWIPLEELPAAHPELAKTPEAAKWQRRVLAPELDKHQAITAICGRMYVHPQRWAEAALEGGMRARSGRRVIGRFKPAES